MLMQAEGVREGLERDGIVVLSDLVSDHALGRMQSCYERALELPTWNTWIGYEQNEKWRRLVENLLLYDRAFVELAVNAVVNEVIREYIGGGYCLVEARGWETIATRRDFHGWHADAWCSPGVDPRPREVKLGCYLTDVTSGQFQYIKGSHLTDEPARHWADREVEALRDRLVEVVGKAGTCFMFDTAGIHRQSTPVLQRRWVIMYNYHDPEIRLGTFATGYGRYHPLLLNAAFLGDLTREQLRVLGVGRTPRESAFHPSERRYPGMHKMIHLASRVRLELQDWSAQFRRLREAIGRRIQGP